MPRRRDPARDVATGSPRRRPQSFTPTLAALADRRTALGMTPVVVGDLDLDLAGACVELEGFFLTGDLVVGTDIDAVDLAARDHGHRGRPRGAGRRRRLGRLTSRAERCAPRRRSAPTSPHARSSSQDCVVDGRGAQLRACGGAPGGAGKDAVAAPTTLPPDLERERRHVRRRGAARVGRRGRLPLPRRRRGRVQTQEGCLRHCYLGPDLTTPPAHPPAYRCGPFPPPTFASVGFEAAGYYALELEPRPPAALGGERRRRGRRLPPRPPRPRGIGALRRRIHEFVPLGLRAGL